VSGLLERASAGVAEPRALGVLGPAVLTGDHEVED
jgi:hypothetical protein